jgi:hypothetical protein
MALCLHMAKYIIGGIVLLFIGFVGFSLWKSTGTEAQSAPPPAPAVFVAATSTYSSSTIGYSAVYPKEYRVDENYAYDQFGPKKLIHGVKFLIPDTMATGTNLSSNDTGISLEQLPNAIRCTGDIYLKADVRARAETINGVNYSIASSTEGAAGNTYEEVIYALADSKPCTAMRYFIHSSNMSNYTPGAVREFDMSALQQSFDSIRDSLKPLSTFTP